MRLVIEYMSGDGHVYSCKNTVPVEYESAETFAVEFEQFCHEKYHMAQCPPYTSFNCFMFAGKYWDVSDFFENKVYYPPEISTVDEWFSKS